MDKIAVALKKQAESYFMRKGVIIAILSGVTYGFYTAFLTLGDARGVWADWYGAKTTFIALLILSAMSSATNDCLSGIWSMVNLIIKGEAGDFFRTLKTRPGIMMCLCAVIGGPVASTCYVVALQMGGSVIVPIASLNAVFGALIGHFAFRQHLDRNMIIGIFICLFSATVIGGTSFARISVEAGIGCLVALICALGWGIEGAVGGFGTALIDYQIGIAIRQCTAGFVNLVILVPVLCAFTPDPDLQTGNLFVNAFGTPVVIFFAISGLFSAVSYAFWYKGNSMCGAALGMVCNGSYAFWGPFCCWVIIGLIAGDEGYSLGIVQWLAALVMVYGIAMVGGLNPLEVFRNKGGEAKQ